MNIVRLSTNLGDVRTYVSNHDWRIFREDEIVGYGIPDRRQASPEVYLRYLLDLNLNISCCNEANASVFGKFFGELFGEEAKSRVYVPKDICLGRRLTEDHSRTTSWGQIFDWMQTMFRLVMTTW